MAGWLLLLLAAMKHKMYDSFPESTTPLGRAPSTDVRELCSSEPT